MESTKKTIATVIFNGQDAEIYENEIIVLDEICKACNFSDWGYFANVDRAGLTENEFIKAVQSLSKKGIISTIKYNDSWDWFQITDEYLSENGKEKLDCYYLKTCFNIFFESTQSLIEREPFFN